MTRLHSAYFGVLFYTDHDCLYCHKTVKQHTRHWCANSSHSGGVLILCMDCDTWFAKSQGHSCSTPSINWRQNPNGTITFGPFADCPVPTIWGAKPVPVPPSTKDRLQRQIERLRKVYLGDDVGQLSEIIPVLDDLALDL